MSLREINRVSANIETATRAGEFVFMLRCLAGGRGDMMQSAELAEARSGAGSLAATVLRAAVTVGSLTSAAPIAGFPQLVDAFMTTLRGQSAFDAMLPSMVPVPLRSRFVVVTGSASGSIIGEGSVKPLSMLSVTADTLSPQKAVSVICCTNELLRLGGEQASRLFSSELTGAVVASTDASFIATLLRGVTPIAASGTTVVSLWDDLARAALAIHTSAKSRLFVITTPDIAKAWALLLNDSVAAFPQMTPHGGSIQGMTVIASDGVPANSYLMVDASQVLAGTEGLRVDSTRTADIQFDDVGDSPVTSATVMRSLWQSDMTALRIERYFSVSVPRGGSVVLVNNVSYAPNSP